MLPPRTRDGVVRPPDAAARYPIHGIRHRTVSIPDGRPVLSRGWARQVGLEDGVYLQRGVLAESNAAMVEKARNIVEMLGGQAMSASEARAHLGLGDAGRTTRHVA
jgi:uncharacterized protein (DUF849 family)